jgi:hypothetical protein
MLNVIIAIVNNKPSPNLLYIGWYKPSKYGWFLYIYTYIHTYWCFTKNKRRRARTIARSHRLAGEPLHGSLRYDLLELAPKA